MKKTFTLLLLILVWQNTIAQNRCDRLVYYGHYLPFDTVGIQFTSDYVISQGKLLSHIGDRKLYSELNLCNSMDDRFIYDEGLIVIEFGHEKVVSSDYFYTVENSTIFSSKDMPYGILPMDSIVPCISSIVIGSFITPDTAFADLLRPNKYFVYGAIKPIKAYRSSSGFIYIYLFGNTFRDDSSLDLSYMAKLIYSPSGEYIGRIVERGKRLNYFRFFDCCNFVGF